MYVDFMACQHVAVCVTYRPGSILEVRLSEVVSGAGWEVVLCG